MNNTLRIAVIGAGPAGFFATGSLLAQKEIDVQIDIFDERAVPHGLVRFGVAPDHPEIKRIQKRFEKSLQDERVRLFGNVSLGSDVSLDEFLKFYDRIILTVGAPADFALGIPGEELENVFAAREFVEFYNGEQKNAKLDIDVSGKSAAVIGIGNVAMDVARILAKTSTELEATDLVPHALEKLSQSSLQQVHIIARRGPAEAACTPKELKEMNAIEGVGIQVHGADFESVHTEELPSDKRKVFELLRQMSENASDGERLTLHFHFLTSPVEILGDTQIRSIRMVRNELQETGGRLQAVPVEGSEWELPADLLLRAIRYKGVETPGVPFDERAGVIPNEKGKVTGLSNIYVAGWIKRGPSGLIGDNKKDAEETVKTLLAESSSPKSFEGDIVELLSQKEITPVTKEEWWKIREEELRRGQERGKPEGIPEKFVFLEDIQSFLRV